MLLAVDSSSDSLKIGLCVDGHVLSEYNGPHDRSHSERLLVELDRILAHAEVGLQRIDTFALVIGPGSFTGLRVGAAALLGLAETCQKKIIVATPHRLHHLWLEQKGESAIVVIHCRSDQFFLSEDSEQIETVSLATIVERHADATFAGPGAIRLTEQARKRGAGHNLQTMPLETFSGGELACLFESHADKLETLDPHDVRLNYLVRSQPERLAEEAARRIVIADMKESDLADIMEIETQSFTDAWKYESFVTDMKNRLVITLAARRAGRCIGYTSCLAVDNYGYIANIAVAEEARSAGIGRALLDELCERLRRRGKNLILLDVRVSNVRAVSFYERYGFTILVQRPNFYTNPVEDSYTMSLEMRV